MYLLTPVNGKPGFINIIFDGIVKSPRQRHSWPDPELFDNFKVA
jgi:hypothetical protein